MRHEWPHSRYPILGLIFEDGMTTSNKKRRPLGYQGATPITADFKEPTTVTKSNTILSEAPRPGDMLNGVFIVLVTHKEDGELRYRRRTFFDLRAAQRHADRLTMNGRTASVTLCRLAPVHEFGGGREA